MKKASEIFEGENSSLRKTYQEAVKIEQEIMKMFDKRFCSFNLSADERCEECLHKTFDGSSVADHCGSADEYIKSFISHIITLVQKREREEVVEKIHKLLENSEKYVLYQRIHYKSALTDLLELITVAEIGDGTKQYD